MKKVCRLILNKITIKKERQGGTENLETQATKMKLLAGKYYSEVSVGITARIPFLKLT